MPFDSNGVFSRVMNWTQDQQDGIAIECGRHDDEDDNFANGFNDCFCRDGRAAATGNFNLGSHKIQNLAAGKATTDAVNKGQIDNITTNMVKISGNQTIAGTKTFSASPNVPTPATSDNSTKVATTAYVKNQGYALDNTVVHKSSTETITGAKTFTAQTQFASGQGIRFNTSSDDEYYVMRSSGAPAFGCSLLLNNNPSTAAYNVTSTKITIGSGTILPNSITPATSDNSTRIATTAYVKNQGYALDNDVVHKSGNETIGGTKTFTSNVVINKSLAALDLENTDLAKGTTPTTASPYCAVNFKDKNGNTLGDLLYFYNNSSSSAKETGVSLRAYKANAASDRDVASLTIAYPASGDPYAQAPASDDVNSIVTTINKSKAANGYFQLGNGLIVQWGYKANSGTHTVTVTLPKAFTTTNYAVTASRYDSEWTEGVMMQTNNYKTTSFDLTVNTPGAHWIAIGY